ncbi:T9SS type A sorting domain-containing protein [Flavobacterium sp. NRK F10]|uniref:T9SS type A sorting domain-containing protein n=1 Tax=Flavobacterium sp. NRK F10 TaxID=2954931 RepID=UPI002091A95B|nr:T9SS type A sorting domain-containing protein [Flavobacterium sp. NRK F10]MCO6175464.1 T9SS type A sorting domain-containing protein [Flavobacterium sp. NRK F10]
MKQSLLLISLIFGINISVKSQMYVSPGTSVLVNDQFLYVKADIRLDDTSRMYLRNQSQLLQATTSIGLNTGTGLLSVFQEGTSDNFQYNYWCSPVGFPGGTLNNMFGITQLYRPTGLTTSMQVGIAPYNQFDGVADPLTVASRWIYKFSASNSYSQWVYVGASHAVNPGLGFTMKGVSGTDNLIADPAEGVENNSGNAQRYDFRGKPYDGNISNAVAIDNLTLIGNPYSSAIDLNSFLMDPLNAAYINGQAYFWEQSSTTHLVSEYDGGYGIYNPGTGIYTPADFWNYDGEGSQETDLGGTGVVYQRRFSPIGQGFMVKGVANGNVVMRNRYRVYVKEGAVNLSEFQRGGAVSQREGVESEYFERIPNIAGIDYTKIKKTTSPYIRVNTIYNDQATHPSTIAFDDHATNGFDYGYDGQSASENASKGFYYIVEDSPFEYVATAIKFDIDVKIPVGFRCDEETNFKVQVEGVYSGFDENQGVYLHDKQTNIYYDIKNNSFSITLPEGDNKTRFEITFRNYDKELLNQTTLLEDAFEVYQDNQNAVLTILNTLGKDVLNVEMYDVTGKVVINKENLGKGNEIKFPTTNLTDGVYIVRVKTRDLSLDKKVLVSRK